MSEVAATRLPDDEIERIETVVNDPATDLDTRSEYLRRRLGVE